MCYTIIFTSRPAQTLHFALRPQGTGETDQPKWWSLSLVSTSSSGSRLLLVFPMELALISQIHCSCGSLGCSPGGNLLLPGNIGCLPAIVSFVVIYSPCSLPFLSLCFHAAFCFFPSYFPSASPQSFCGACFHALVSFSFF